MKSDLKKNEGIVKLAPPTNKLEVRSLVGMVTILNCFIPNTTALLEPICKLLKNDIQFSWDEEQKPFQQIKTAITQTSSLAYFYKDTPCEVQCDASFKGIGVCLLQNNNPIYFASKILTETESRYSNIEREMLGVVFALTRLWTQQMLVRIQGYDCNIRYRPACKIPVPSVVSRISFRGGGGVQNFSGKVRIFAWRFRENC